MGQILGYLQSHVRLYCLLGESWLEHLELPRATAGQSQGMSSTLSDLQLFFLPNKEEPKKDFKLNVSCQSSLHNPWWNSVAFSFYLVFKGAKL